MKLKNLYTAIIVLTVLFVASAFAQDEPAIEEPLLDEELQMLDEELQLLPEVLQLLGTISLSVDGWSDPTVGDWDPDTLTGKLTHNLAEPIQIVSDGITLDGAGYTVKGSGEYYGVHLLFRTNVTVKNLTVEGFIVGIYIGASDYNTLTSNSANLNEQIGIWLSSSNNNTLTGNNANSNLNVGICLLYSSDNTLIGNTANQGRFGISLSASINSTLTNNSVSLNSEHGIHVSSSDYIQLTGNTASNNRYGISVYACDYIKLTDNTVNSSYASAIEVYDSDYSQLTGNTADSSSGHGISLSSSSNSELTGNNSNSNYSGISLNRSSNNTLTDNSMSANRYNFAVSGAYSYSDYDHNIDTTNTVDGKPIYYIRNAVGGIYGSSTNAGVIYAINCDDITIKDLTLTNNKTAIALLNTHNSNIENVTASNNWQGIRLSSSSDNTLTNNSANSNNRYGFYVGSSDRNTLTNNSANSNNQYGFYFAESDYNSLTGNTVSDNYYGLYLISCSYNEIYSNDFIDNIRQAFDYEGTENVFNKPAPIGGNYWSNWKSPDTNGDGFVDYPYIFPNNQDNLPLVPQGPQELLGLLIDYVVLLNIHEGISNSLDAKLDAAFKALDDLNKNNDVAVINALEAFINAVEAQRGNKIPDADANALIAAANEIIALLSEPPASDTCPICGGTVCVPPCPNAG